MKASEFPLNSTENITPDMLPSVPFMDADDELKPMARLIGDRTPHNFELNVDKIKFLYTNKAKKEGGKYCIGELIVRSDKEKAIYDAYDYALLVYHPTWKELDAKNKFIQLDRLLCGVEVETKKTGEEVTKKAPFDCREYVDNMMFWGADPVLKSSEIVHLAITRYLEDQKEKSKTAHAE